MPDHDSTTPTAVALGQRAEQAATHFLERAGLRVVARNVRCRGGEIDLIALDNATLVFVEVRSRRPGRFGTAGDSITFGKRRRIVLAAQHFLARAPQHAQRACRFDCILIDGHDTQWIRDAFAAD